MTSCAILALMVLTQHPHASSAIILDGEFDDWVAQPIAFTDPFDAAQAFIDFGELRIKHDNRFVHLQCDFGKTVNAQGLDGTALLLLDTDGDAQTGTTEHGLAGVDVIVALSPEKHKYPGEFQGVGLRSTTYLPDPNDPAKPELNPYDIGFAFAPTHAGRRFEFRFERGARLPETPQLFAGSRFSAKFVFIDASKAVADETQIINHELTPTEQDEHQTNAASDPLAKNDAGALRVVSWNVQRGGMFKQPEPFARVLQALQPDILLLVELNDNNTAAQVQRFLDQTLPAASPWQVAFGEGGGDLRCAVASRLPLSDVPEVKLIAMPAQPDRSVRATGAAIDVGGRKLLAMAVHLKCCGRAHGPEDQAREIEVTQIAQAVQAACAATKFDGLVIGGDLNLVGARDPLEMLARSLDCDHSPLAVPQTYQLDGLSNATWADRNQPFIPGRLDYLLYSDSTMECLAGFAFDSRDLDQQWSAKHQVQAEDTSNASDHLPVVIDLRWLMPGPAR